eukprot:6746819-Pyramimonas_sp.AAC.1
MVIINWVNQPRSHDGDRFVSPFRPLGAPAALVKLTFCFFQQAPAQPGACTPTDWLGRARMWLPPANANRSANDSGDPTSEQCG